MISTFEFAGNISVDIYTDRNYTRLTNSLGKKAEYIESYKFEFINSLSAIDKPSYDKMYILHDHIIAYPAAAKLHYVIDPATLKATQICFAFVAIRTNTGQIVGYYHTGQRAITIYDTQYYPRLRLQGKFTYASMVYGANDLPIARFVDDVDTDSIANINMHEFITDHPAGRSNLMPTSPPSAPRKRKRDNDYSFSSARKLQFV